jgi:DNA repair protein RAD7
VDWATVSGDDKSTDRDTYEGGIALSKKFRAMSVNESTSEGDLIGAEYGYEGGRNYEHGDGWSEVQTKSWHTKSQGTASASSSHGDPSSISRAGTARTYTSSVAERSSTSEVRSNGWAKIRAYSPTRDAHLAGAVMVSHYPRHSHLF